MQPRHWPLLDAVRFFAALLVLFGHVRGLVLVGIDQVEGPTVLTKAVYLITGLQHEAVVIFFVVSGFLIGGKAWDLIRAGTFDTTAYFISRFSRIYIVYLPSLALVAALNGAGYALLAGTRFYAERPLFPSGVTSGWTLDQIPCHLFSVQGVMCAPWGANPPLWSLGFEWIFYLIAPAFFFALLARRSASWAPIAIVTAASLLALQALNPTVGFWLLVWLTGTIAYVASDKGRINGAIGGAGVVLCLAALIVSRTKALPVAATDIAITAGIGLAFASRPLVAWQFRSAIIERCARFSYSLYLTHLPACVFFGAVLESAIRWPHSLVQPDAVGLGAVALLIACGLATAWLFALATEDHTDRLRAILKTMLLRAPRSA